MSKIYLDRLIKKYGFIKSGEMSGTKYQDLISAIISQNNTNISNNISKISNDKWSAALKKISTKEKRFIMPDLSDVLPKRAPHILKSAERGKLISQTLRDSLTANLRESLNQFTEKTKEQTYITRRGAKAGRINPKVIAEFEQRITDTFQNYVKKDPKIGMPKNIKNIAVTEIRTTVNTTKKIYTDKLREKNPDLKLRKRWIHNDSLSKNPDNFHWGHKKLDGKTVDYDDMFDVKQYKLFNGKHILMGIIKMFHPHSEEGGTENNIGCHCDWELIIRR